MSTETFKLGKYGPSEAWSHTGIHKSAKASKLKKNKTRLGRDGKGTSQRRTNKTSDLKGNKSKERDIYNIEVDRTPNSCLIYIGKSRWRALIDSGADISVMSDKMYRKLKVKSKIRPVSQVLQGAGGQPLQVKGVTELSFVLGKQHFTQTCYVISGASRNLILGVDFLKKHRARIYFDLEKLRLNGEYIDLDQDIHIASVVRIADDVTLPPQTKQSVEGKMKKSPYFQPGQLCEFKQDDKSWLVDEPGLLVANSVSVLDDRSRCKVLLVNSTNKTYKFKKGSIIGTASVVDEADVSTLEEVTKQNTKDFPVDPDFSNVDVPEQYRELLLSLLQENKDVFAAHDTDFGRTDTVTMKIDTKDHAPIKQRPYRTPLAQHKIVDDAVDEMLEKGIIERSNSPWASPIVLVKKKDGSTRFCVEYRKLNSISTVLAVPLPIIDDLLAVLGKAVFFLHWT